MLLEDPPVKVSPLVKFPLALVSFTKISELSLSCCIKTAVALDEPPVKVSPTVKFPSDLLLKLSLFRALNVISFADVVFRMGVISEKDELFSTI